MWLDRWFDTDIYWWNACPVSLSSTYARD